MIERTHEALPGRVDVRRRGLSACRDVRVEMVAHDPGVLLGLRDRVAARSRDRSQLRRLIHRVMSEAAGGRPVAFGHVAAALALIRGGGPPVDGPGLRMQRAGGSVVLTGRPAGVKGRPAKAAPSNFSHVSLPIPGKVSTTAWVVSADAASSAPASSGAVAGRGPVAVVRLDRLQTPLAVRPRKPGDRFAPAGLIGRKKLQDFFVDLKVARDRRDLVPIVVDATDRIVWVAGYAIDREFAVTDSAQAVVILRLKHLGGLG